MIKNIKDQLRLAKRTLLTETLPRLCYKSERLSSMYYFLFDNSFSREHRAVLSGTVKHISEVKKTKNNYFLLVRNTHRIEKGLLMRPKRAVFGKEYIGETIECFSGVWNPNQIETNAQMKWFYDVLSEYFSGAKEDSYINSLYERFKQIVSESYENNNAPATVKSVPYIRQANNFAQIPFDEFYKLTKQRRSVRWFLNKPVPREILDKAILAANQAPSACNRQPFEFRIYDDPELLKEVVGYPMGIKGYGHSIPVLIVIVGNLDAYFEERDRHVMYIDASLASMSLMLALETLGLSSCSINWPDIESLERKMENFLKIEKYQRPIMCMGIGYPDPEGMVAFSEKRPLEHIRKYN
jgi:nitroreductase